MPNTTSAPAASNYRDLRVWKLAMDLVVDVYALSQQFPKEEQFGLTAQIRRAAVSIPTNIAEGKSRFGSAEYRRFVSIACGSLAEVETELALAVRLKFVSAAECTHCVERASSVGRMLTNLAKSLTP